MYIAGFTLRIETLIIRAAILGKLENQLALYYSQWQATLPRGRIPFRQRFCDYCSRIPRQQQGTPNMEALLGRDTLDRVPFNFTTPVF